MKTFLLENTYQKTLFACVCLDLSPLSICPDLPFIAFECHFLARIVTICVYLSSFALTVEKALGI